MTREKIELLQEELLGLHLATGHLGYSLERCQDLIGQDGLPPEQLERLESLSFVKKIIFPVHILPVVPMTGFSKRYLYLVIF